MRKVLAVASVTYEHRQLVYKELKKIGKRIKISLPTLLQAEIIRDTFAPENGNVFRSYPYITLTIPDYEEHREHLEKIYKNNVLFDKFVLLISEGGTYEDLAQNRNEEILKEHCRNWNTSVSCSFESVPLFDDIEDQVRKMDQVMGDLDIRGKITEIDAKKKFHLIEDHRKGVDDGHPPGVPVDVRTPNKTTLLKLFFGLVVGCGRKGKGICRGGAVAAVGAGNNRYNYNDAEFMDYEEDEKMMDQGEETQDIDSWQGGIQDISWGGSSGRRGSQSSSGRKGGIKRQAKSRFEQPLARLQNPYMKKSYPCEVELSINQMS